MTFGTPYHNMSRTSTYKSWQAMRQRCENPRYHYFETYGGRGIKVCERWQSFENFLADMGEKPSRSHSIERTNNNGNYEPDNCCWATKKEQSRNTRTNRIVTAFGRTEPLVCFIEGGPNSKEYERVRRRLERGWDVERAIIEPPYGRI